MNIGLCFASAERIREMMSFTKSTTGQKESFSVTIAGELTSEEAEIDGEKKEKSQVLTPPEILSRSEMDDIISVLREVFDGDDFEMGKAISGALMGKDSSLHTLSAVLENDATRNNFLLTITQPGYVFFLLNCHFHSPRAILNMINILLSDNPARSIERAALSRKLNETLGTPPGSDNSRVMNFARVFEEACSVAVGALALRMNTLWNLSDLEADFRDFLGQEDIQMPDFAEAANISLEELTTIAQLTLTCQIEELKAFFENLSPAEAEEENVFEVGLGFILYTDLL